MSESIIDTPNMKLRSERHMNKNALLKQHSEDDATTSTLPNATAPMTTQPAKHQLAPELSDEDQQTAWAEHTGTSVKRRRLDPFDRVAASDLQVSPTSSIMSSSLHPPSQSNELGNASTHTNLGQNESMIVPLEVSHTLRAAPFYQPWAPSVLESQTRGHSDYYATPIPDSADLDENEELDLLRKFTYLDPESEHDTAVSGSIPTLPAESSSSCRTEQQIVSVPNPDSESHHLQSTTPQSISYSSSQEQTTLSSPDAEAITQVPLADNAEGQTRHFPSTTGDTSFSLTLSKPAQAKDLDNFPWLERHLISAYARNQKDEEDVDLKRWYHEIRKPFWAQIISSFGKIPASLYERVLHELCASHPCRHNPWTGHGLYRSLLGKDGKHGTGCLTTLKEWMYGTGTTTLATWRDTLSTKTRSSSCGRVPWVQREKLIALSVILDCADAASKDIKTAPAAGRMKRNIQSKFEILEQCKLTYLLSNQDRVVANGYWDGLAEELEEDPEQKHLYDKVMRARQSSTPGSSMTCPSSPIHRQESPRQGGQSHSGSPGQSQPGGQSSQAGPDGVGDSQILADVGESTPQHSGDDVPSSLAQRNFLPAENTNEDTVHTPNLITEETSLQDRVRQLEGEVTELRRYIELIYQRFPGPMDPPPQASSQHQP